jgi:hypothetical protein
LQQASNTLTIAHVADDNAIISIKATLAPTTGANIEDSSYSSKAMRTKCSVVASASGKCGSGEAAAGRCSRAVSTSSV